MNHKSMPLEVRFWKRVDKQQDSACWNWMGSRHRHGYGMMNSGLNHPIYGSYQTLLTHRISWELHCGPIPDGLQVLHKCDNPSCVNPNHLFLGTHLDNMHDRDRKGRHGRPESKKTHCPYGHPYSGANVYMDGGSRCCRTCSRIKAKIRYIVKKPKTPQGYDRKTARMVFEWLEENGWKVVRK